MVHDRHSTSSCVYLPVGHARHNVFTLGCVAWHFYQLRHHESCCGCLQCGEPLAQAGHLTGMAFVPGLYLQQWWIGCSRAFVIMWSFLLPPPPPPRSLLSTTSTTLVSGTGPPSFAFTSTALSRSLQVRCVQWEGVPLLPAPRLVEAGAFGSLVGFRCTSKHPLHSRLRMFLVFAQAALRSGRDCTQKWRSQLPTSWAFPSRQSTSHRPAATPRHR